MHGFISLYGACGVLNFLSENNYLTIVEIDVAGTHLIGVRFASSLPQMEKIVDWLRILPAWVLSVLISWNMKIFLKNFMSLEWKNWLMILLCWMGSTKFFWMETGLGSVKIPHHLFLS